MKTIIYTCIIGNYDNLEEIKTVHRAICFTDSNIRSETWEIIKIKPTKKIFRKVKICPHLYLPEHDRNVWVDGNVVIENIDQFIEDKAGFAIQRHLKRNCIYKEAVTCIDARKDTEKVIMAQVNKYYAEGYPFDNGMVESCIIIRDNTEKNRAFGESWWNEVKRFSVRDQISFNYVAWKTEFVFNTFFPWIGFQRNLHNKKNPPISTS